MFGFFGFITALFCWCLVLQWVARFVFAYHKGAASKMLLSTLLPAFYHGFPLDLAWVGYCFLLLSLFLFMYLQFGKLVLLRILQVVALVVILTSVFTAFVDAELFSRWGVRFNSQALQYLYSPNEAVASSSEAAWFKILVITLTVAAVFLFVFNKILRAYQRQLTTQRDWLKPSAAFLLVSAFSFLGARGGWGTIPISQSSVVYSANSLQNTLAVNSAWNFCYYLINKSDVPRPQEFRPPNAVELNSLKAYAPLNPSSDSLTLLNRPNVCIIMLESFTANASGFLGGKFSAMPFLDSLASQGLSFTRAYAQGDRTDKGLACTISGWPGQPWQSILHEPDKAAKLPTLPGVFSKKGYPTAFVYGGDLSFANMKSFLASGGFQTIVDENDYRADQITSKWGAHDEHAFQKLLELNDKAGMPFFHVLLSLSSHEPFDVPGKRTFPENDINGKFLNSIKYTDDCIRQFIIKAKSKSWFQNTLFVFVADHGRDIGLPETAFNRDGNFKIPIVFWGPALNPALRGKKTDRVVAQADIAQTLCSEVLHEQKHIFPYSRNLLSNQSPSMAVFLFNGGVGLVSAGGTVVFENREKSTYTSMNDDKSTAEILKIVRDLQYKLVSDYWSF